MEDADWGIHYLVVDTRNWWPARKVLFSPRSIKDIDWTKRQVDLNVVRQRVKDAPTYEASTVVDRAYENHFNNYYGDRTPVVACPTRKSNSFCCRPAILTLGRFGF